MPQATLKDRNSGSTSPRRDLRHLTGDWPGSDLAARIVSGIDGRAQMQLRIDGGLGIVQLEVDGPPDQRHRDVTWLRELRRHDQRALTPEQSDGLALEGRLVARRYLGWFLMEEWNRVIRDTGHHLAAMKLLLQEAPTRHRDGVNHWIPYAVMMRARAQAARHNDEFQHAEAVEVLSSAIRRIKRHRVSIGVKAAGQQELVVLRQALAAVRRVLERDPRQRLHRLIDRCVKTERYERAALLRDQMIRTSAGASSAGR